jgi:hypothetical protein
MLCLREVVGKQKGEGYNIFRGNTSGGPYSKINSVLDPNTAYTDNSVVSGQTYYYVTTALDSSGHESRGSNEGQSVCGFCATLWISDCNDLLAWELHILFSVPSICLLHRKAALTICPLSPNLVPSTIERVG